MGVSLLQMALKSYQKMVDRWVNQYKVGYFKPLEILARLVEEVGEVARELNHRFGPKKKKSTEDTADLGEEVADVIFTLICLANSLNIDLDKSFKKMMKKYSTRDNNRFKKR
jgi:NTP pyrophosphatase (non-canonical NTP hydrolase)